MFKNLRVVCTEDDNSCYRNVCKMSVACCSCEIQAKNSSSSYFSNKVECAYNIKTKAGLQIEEQWFSNFHEPWPTSKFNWQILNISSHLGYAISRQSYLAKASARGPQRTAPWPPRGSRAPFEKPWKRASRDFCQIQATLISLMKNRCEFVAQYKLFQYRVLFTPSTLVIHLEFCQTRQCQL